MLLKAQVVALGFFATNLSELGYERELLRCRLLKIGTAFDAIVIILSRDTLKNRYKPTKTRKKNATTWLERPVSAIIDE